MTTNVGCIAVLLGTMEIVTGAAADESNASLTEKRGLSHIVPQLALPPAKFLAKVRETLEPMSAQIIALKRQIQNLRHTRDLLLPRLLSGQVVLETNCV